MDIFFTKPSTRLDRDELYTKAFNAVDDVVTADTEFNIEFSQDDLDNNRAEVVIDIPAKFYNPDNKKCRIKFTPDELTPETIANTLGKRTATSLFLNDEWYSRSRKRAREDALQEALTGNNFFNWGGHDDDFRSN